jgi:hypothetical protein
MTYAIKKLEWKDDDVDPNFVAARTAFIIYYYDIRKEPRITLYGCRNGVVRYFKTLENAKDAAQADYEKEVKKHLVLKSPDVQGDK